ncbi:MAG: bifunctional [glutamate--ammonia ligase]-adenylyl-L-tyrosine phosphorylase/[glutamate--ammonia-ligase] adenylyltransferase [Steroidobacteraceae bacterium]|jgi:glutamate-ammonia-ligase adenylyltransferase
MQQGLEAALAHAWCALAERAPAVAAALRGPPNTLSASAPAVLTASEFVLDALCRDPKLWPALLARAGERLAGEPLALPQLPPAGPDMHGSHSAGEAVFMAELRRWRRAEFTRIAWRDIAQWASLDETLAQLSHAAECALRLAQQFAERSLALRFGQPRNAALESQQLIIVAMGKLGGGELNFSSDIDLVLLYPENGETDGATPLDNQEYFTRLAQLLLRLLEQPTEEGFVFRVDLRLRPFGDSGPVVSSAAALEDYLQIHGRDWERYAWVKARAITNEASYAQLLRTTIRPFVYRRYLDFGVLESLAHMKELIEREVQRRELADNIKLGDGGIREIEFIVQSFQLIRGGQDRRLQGSSLRRALPLLAGVKLLPSAAVAELDAAYVFLRRVENRLQMRADQQVHKLPSDELERERLARSMDCAAWPQLAELIGAHRGRVAAHFRALLLGSTAEHAGAALPLSDGDLAALSARLDAVGLKQSAEAARLLLDFAHQASRRLDQNASRRLAALLPLLIDDIVPASASLPTLRRVLQVLEAIGSRSAYLALLQHNTRARLRLVQLASHGDFLIGQIAAHPLLLDELLDQSILDQPPDRAALAADLEQRMDGADQEDEEQLIERLCQFQRAAFFRLGVADLFSRLPVMQVSDRLTDIAELIVERALVLTWQQLAPTLGVPMCGAGAQRRPVRLCVVGYGKLGGMELSYASDLDLVFLHDSSGPQQETEGSRRVDNQLFFLRFAQRMVHLLSMHSASGRLYEVDMRLRPSGKAGMLITGMDAFAEYQRHQAWTWEHQALLHARAVAGAPELIERFETLRTEVLRLHVRRATLRQDVGQMRNRQRAELSRTTTDKLDLKQDPGGIGDIEFLAQYWALKWARGYPPLVHYADTIRQLESLASADLVAQAQVDVLTGAYRAYRTLLHHHALEGGGELILPGEFAAERAAVKAIWEQVMGT